MPSIDQTNLGDDPTDYSVPAGQSFQSQDLEQNSNLTQANKNFAVPDNQIQTQSSQKDVYNEMCTQIIKEQREIIGDVAIEQANLVDGLTVDPRTLVCVITGDGQKIINDLITIYRDFFGHTAVEVCKEASSKFLINLPNEEKPELLK